jgi:CDP-glycerol glycerophosphotransferase
MKYSPTRILGALRRRQLDLFRSVIYQSFKRFELEDAILFESFQGKVVGDSPYALFEEIKKRSPRAKLIVSVALPGVAPEGAIAVRYGSVSWLRALATSKVLINNTNFPGYFRKREGQSYIQTWHGTPLKRLGRDISELVPMTSYLKMMDREASYWDFLISPSNYCTKLFPKAFNYSGKIVETGYPRNDALVNQASKRSLIRKSLGILDEKQKVVLYAPTWRDYQRTATGNWKPVNFLSDGLGENYTLLFRGHTNTYLAHSESFAKNAIDVTNYKNVAELYLAADVLVTDYSSSMFDFSVTGKPMVFLAPDLDIYLQKRGFYFDFEAEAPGPIIKDPKMLTELLATADSWQRDFNEKYRAWQQKFNALEDGKASSRVLEQCRTAFHSLF